MLATSKPSLNRPRGTGKRRSGRFLHAAGLALSASVGVREALLGARRPAAGWTAVQIFVRDPQNPDIFRQDPLISASWRKNASKSRHSFGRGGGNEAFFRQRIRISSLCRKKVVFCLTIFGRSPEIGWLDENLEGITSVGRKSERAVVRAVTTKGHNGRIPPRWLVRAA